MPERITSEPGHNHQEKPTRRAFSKKLGLVTAGAAAGYYFWQKREQNREQSNKPKEILWRAEFTDAFPKNQARMSQQNIEKFKTDILRILKEAAQDPDKTKKFSEARIFLEASSDERQTSTWPGGNEGLSQARTEEIKKIYQQALEELKTADSETYKQLSEFVKKQPVLQMAISPEHGRGVKSLTQMTNPQTNKPYSKAELEKLSPEQREKLYNECRYVALRVELPAGDERQKQYKETVERLAAFSKIKILVDRSGSMEEDNKILSKKISDALVSNYNGLAQKSLEIGSFCQQIDNHNYIKIEKKSDIDAFLKNMVHFGADEYQLAVANEVLDKITSQQAKDAEPTAVLILTDEDIRDFDITDLNNLIKKCEQTNTTVFFGLINDETKLITTLDAKGLLFEFENYLKSFNVPEFFPDNLTDWKSRRDFLLDAPKNDRILEKGQPLSIDKYGNIKFKIQRSHLYDCLYGKINGLEKALEAEKDKIEALMQGELQPIKNKHLAKDDLNLTYEGTEKIKPVLEKYFKQTEAIKNRYNSKIKRLKDLATKLNDL